ncbi:hydrolase, TatD family protein [Toxoplasma gondii p89]|uniref:Hydrolase, TatD family protein n=2 Tax=Toxoplasma gondii TaxID=5811 RepID=A0A086KS27_TOXGO|nr:hydrolase, TatD family protein [Toxoplasma gondii p89]
MKVTGQREKESSEKRQVNLHPCGVFRSAKRRSTMHSATRGGAVLSRFRRFFLCALFFLETVVRAMHPAGSLSKSGAISVSARKRLFSCFQAPLARFSFCKTARAPQTPKTRRPSSFSPCGPRSFSPSPVSRSSFSLPVSLVFPLGLLSSVHRSPVFPLLPARLGGDFECNVVRRIDFSFLRSTFCRASSLRFSAPPPAPPSATRFLSLNRVAGKRYLSSRTQTGVPDNWHTMEGRAQPAFVDIGANLTDDMYRGVYFGKERHPADLERVIARAKQAGCRKLMVTGGSLADSGRAIELCREFDPDGKFLFATVGVHPTRCSEFEPSSHMHVGAPPHGPAACCSNLSCANDSSSSPSSSSSSSSPSSSSSSSSSSPSSSAGGCGAEAAVDAEVRSFGLYLESTKALLSFEPPAEAVEHLSKLASLIEKNRDRVVAVGEIGLDADRTQFCDLETQKKYFELQLLLSRYFRLPLFLHMRDAEAPFCEILARRRELWEAEGGVVHSFTDSLAALNSVLSLSPALHIGINGCSLKTEENLQVVKAIPLERLHLETDAPWCDIRPTHAGFAILTRELPSIAAEEKKKQKPQNWNPETQIKNRNEPCNIAHVARIVRQLVAPEMPFEAFTEAVCANSLRMFPLMAAK